MKIKTFLILVFISLIFLKTDFRFIENINCCGDDHDYYLHAETLSLDFDLDYSNQLKGIENKRYKSNGKIAPIGFFGSGLLASPFLFIGNFIDNFLASKTSNLFNYRILFYSFSSIFYLGLAVIYLEKAFKILNIYQNKYLTLLIYSGSGIFYFAFERYSMTHVYEIFTISLIIFYSARLYHDKSSNKTLDLSLLFISFLLSFLVRWVNYFILLIPFIIKFIKGPGVYVLTKKLKFLSLLYLTSSIAIFLIISKFIYGIFTLDPRKIYLSEWDKKNSFIDESIIEFLLSSITDFFKIIITPEFGILWFSPAIFISLLISIYNFFSLRSEKKLFYFLCLLSYAQTFAIVIVWGAIGSSYGMRYLYCLIPLSLLIIADFNLKNSLLIKIYIITFSIFSSISILFFETTEGTQLSLSEVKNTFGNIVIYSQPNYLGGFLESILDLNSYLIIFTTSFLGAIFLKILITIFEKEYIFSFLSSLSLPVENEDFQLLIIKLEQISFNKFILYIILISLILKKIVTEFSSSSIKKT
jgi:hypothetical protein